MWDAGGGGGDGVGVGGWVEVAKTERRKRTRTGYSCCLNFVVVPKRTTISMQYNVKGGMGGWGGMKVASTERRKIFFVRDTDKRNTEIKRDGGWVGGGRQRQRKRRTNRQRQRKRLIEKLTDGGLTEVHKNKDRIKGIHLLKEQH